MTNVPRLCIIETIALINAKTNSVLMENAITFIVNSIQTTMNLWVLPWELLRIMNMWANSTWCHEDGVPKFVHCLRTIVTRKIKKRLFVHLINKMRHTGYVRHNEEDLYYALNNVGDPLDNEILSTMASELTTEALLWVNKHDEHVTDYHNGYFKWYDPNTFDACYHLPHLPKPVINDEHVLISLETLPAGYFQHKADWTCPICLDGAQTTCVRTKCNHVFHKLCLERCKRVKQKENGEKTCCLCPLCRAAIN